MEDLLAGFDVRGVLQRALVEEDDDAHGIAGGDASADHPLGLQLYRDLLHSLGNSDGTRCGQSVGIGQPGAQQGLSGQQFDGRYLAVQPVQALQGPVGDRSRRAAR